MEPILSEKVDYLTKLVGFGRSAIANLYKDRIEIVSKNGSVIETIKLNQLTEAVYVTGVFRLKVGEQRHIITFFRLPYRFFGLIGYAMIKPGEKSKLWAVELEKLGVSLQKKIV
jgi:hypothetical protein